MSHKSIFTALSVCSILFLSSCREDYDFSALENNLIVSADTISVDTVYNFSKSETYVLKLYNPDDKDVLIPHLKLNKGENSYFNIIVDGKSGIEFNNIPIRKKDSLYVFVEIDAKEAFANPLYEDEIIINSNQKSQSIKLLSWVEKAKIHSKNEILTNETWTKDEAHVIEENLTITDALTIEEGTSIYFKKDASLTIANGGKLNVNGRLGKEVKFRSARHDKKYDSIPNQWKKIVLSPNSESKISYAKIIGGDTGLEVTNATLEINNSYIVNHQSYGILANNATIRGYNLLLNNTNISALAIENGGNYEFYHSTFSNYFNMIGTAGNSYALTINNKNAALNNAFFANCIFYSQRASNAIELTKNNQYAFNYSFDTNLFKNGNITTLNVLTEPGFIKSIVGDPEFINPDYKANKLGLKDKSIALNAGKISISQQFPLDYYGKSRTNNPNLGAIQ